MFKINETTRRKFRSCSGTFSSIFLQYNKDITIIFKRNREREEIDLKIFPNIC